MASSSGETSVKESSEITLDEFERAIPQVHTLRLCVNLHQMATYRRQTVAAAGDMSAWRRMYPFYALISRTLEARDPEAWHAFQADPYEQHPALFFAQSMTTRELGSRFSELAAPVPAAVRELGKIEPSLRAEEGGIIMSELRRRDPLAYESFRATRGAIDPTPFFVARVFGLVRTPSA